MLGQPVSMLIPQVIGFKLHGKLREGATATDLVLTVTQMLRKKGVVGKFVEFFGAGLAAAAAGRPRHHRQHGPGVRGDVRHLPGGRRDAPLPARRPAGRTSWSQLVEAYYKEQGMFHDAEHARAGVHRRAGTRPRRRSSRAWPGRRGRRTGSPLKDMKASFARRPAEAQDRRPSRSRRACPWWPPARTRRPAVRRRASPRTRRRAGTLTDGSVVIAAITSCTNTSNPSVMVAAGRAGEEGRRRRG